MPMVVCVRTQHGGDRWLPGDCPTCPVPTATTSLGAGVVTVLFLEGTGSPDPAPPAGVSSSPTGTDGLLLFCQAWDCHPAEPQEVKAHPLSALHTQSLAAHMDAPTACTVSELSLAGRAGSPSRTPHFVDLLPSLAIPPGAMWLRVPGACPLAY